MLQFSIKQFHGTHFSLKLNTEHTSIPKKDNFVCLPFAISSSSLAACTASFIVLGWNNQTSSKPHLASKPKTWYTQCVCVCVHVCVCVCVCICVCVCVCVCVYTLCTRTYFVFLFWPNIWVHTASGHTCCILSVVRSYVNYTQNPNITLKVRFCYIQVLWKVGSSEHGVRLSKLTEWDKGTSLNCWKTENCEPSFQRNIHGTDKTYRQEEIGMQSRGQTGTHRLLPRHQDQRNQHPLSLGSRTALVSNWKKSNQRYQGICMPWQNWWPHVLVPRLSLIELYWFYGSLAKN